jgi:glyoxylase-like metal-dependent hydrolase (beta-lactamase superfamily II)
MGIVFTRRQLIHAAAGVAIAAGSLRGARSQPGGPLEVTDLGGDLALIRGAGANILAFGSADGVLLVDGGLQARSRDVLAILEQRWPGRRVAVLFNTNWRDEHVGVNEAAKAQGANIMAHENTKLWLGGDFFVEWEDRHYSPRPASMLPNTTFYTSGSLAFGGKTIDYRYLPRAHTDGDVAVFFPDANVLVASDLVSVGRYPVPDYATGGWIGGLLAATQALLDATDARTRIVAADGGVLGRAALEAQRALCAAIKDKTAAAFRAGMSFKDFVASRPTAEFDAQWGDPARFLALVYKGGFGHLRELGGVI